MSATNPAGTFAVMVSPAGASVLPVPIGLLESVRV